MADFTPLQAENIKTKRGKDNWSLELKPTIDIAAELGKVKENKQLLVGFALETNDEIQNAKRNWRRKIWILSF